MLFYIKSFFKKIWVFLEWALKWIIALAFVGLILFGIYIGINDVKASTLYEKILNYDTIFIG